MTQPIEEEADFAPDATWSAGDSTAQGAATAECAESGAGEAEAIRSAPVGDSDSTEIDPAADAGRAAAGATRESPEREAADPAGESAEGSTDPAHEPVGDGVGAGDALTDVELASAVAALVYASPDPISERRLQSLLEGPRIERVRAALDTLRERLGNSGLPYELRALAGGWQILTTPDVGEIVQRLAKVRKSERISGAALETLAVVAYRQPVTKAEVEAIRGVQAGPILRTLIERGLVRVSGRSDDPGHALQYGTTKEFLDRFGLGTLADLPRDGELTRD